MSVVIDLNLVCLVCLRKAIKYHSIYENDEQEPHISIVEKITKCSDLNIPTDSAKIPDKLCNGCYDDLQASWRFRQNCKEANTVFQYIQQQDDESEVLATLELESQQIKLPLGLKIKKMITTAKARPSRANSLTPKKSKSIKQTQNTSAVTDDDSPEYEYLTDERTTPTSQTNMEYVALDGNTDEEGDTVDTVDDVYMTEEVTEEEEEILGDTPNCTEETSATIKVKVEQDELDDNPKYRQITTFPVKRGRGRPRKSSTQSSSVLMEQSSNLKQVERKYHANQSSNTLKSTPARRRRTQSIGEGRSPKICDICGNSYKYQHALNAHMRRHNNVRPYACEFCEKSFVACVELQRHMRVHTGHKPYACKFCDRRFSDFGSRLKHERTHTGERPYSCGTCNKSFAYAHVLSVHLRTHTGEKRFQCQRCGRGFTKKAYLLAHQDQHGGRQGCIPKEDSAGEECKSVIAMEDGIYTEEYIVEELNEHENEMLHKDDRVALKYEFDIEGEVQEEDINDTTEQHLVIKSQTETEVDDEQMAEEHLDDVEENELVFEIR